jgi:hypothetical protein
MEAIVRRALNSERGIRIRMPSHGAAINWRQRYYGCRKVVVQREGPQSEWRTLTCALEEIDGAWWCKLVPNDAQLLGFEIEEL